VVALKPSHLAYGRAHKQPDPPSAVIRCDSTALNEFVSHETYDDGCALMVIEHLEDDVGFVKQL